MLTAGDLVVIGGLPPSAIVELLPLSDDNIERFAAQNRSMDRLCNECLSEHSPPSLAETRPIHGTSGRMPCVHHALHATPEQGLTGVANLKSSLPVDFHSSPTEIPVGLVSKRQASKERKHYP